MATNLLSINEDVQLQILQYLSPSDLCAICLVHPHLRRLAQPCLYTAISFKWGQRRWKAYRHPIPSLARSILRRPELAAHIRRLSCRSRAYSGKAPKILVSEVDLNEAVSFVERSQVPYRDAWLEELRSGTMDAYLAVLLLQLPRLEWLRLGADFFLESNLIALVLRSVLFDRLWTTSLQRLRTVSLERIVSRHSDFGVRNTENALPWFYLPSLRSLSVSIDDPVTFSWPTTTPPSASGLVSLKLDEIREAHLGRLLSVAPHLRSLVWVWDFAPDFEDQTNTPIVDLDLIMSTLAQTKATLTDLTIRAFCGPANRVSLPLRLRVQGSLRALAGFDGLKHVTISLAFITGFSLPATESIEKCLPRNLESLTLTDDLYYDVDMDDQWDEVGYTRALLPWLANVEATTPRFQKLCLLSGYTENEIETKDVRTEIRQLASQAGIDFEIRDCLQFQMVADQRSEWWLSRTLRGMAQG